jgi:UDP-glucose 4-epimerase
MSARDSAGGVAVLGAGFLGCHVAAALASAGRPTRLLARSSLSGAPPVPGVEVVAGDIERPADLDRALEGAGEVVYAAGGFLPAESQADPARDVGLTLGPLLATLEALRARPDAHLTLLSSGGTVYGRPRYLPVDEDHPTEPISSYGVLKLASEHYVRVYGALYGLRYRILRCSNVYGEHAASDRAQGAVGAFLHRLARGEPIALYGDGSVVRDYLYVGDLAAAVIQLLDNLDAPAVLNVGSGEGVSLTELLEVVGEATGEPTTVERLPARDLDVEAIVLDVSRLRAAIDFAPRSLDEGVAAVWSAMHAHADAAARPR